MCSSMKAPKEAEEWGCMKGMVSPMRGHPRFPGGSFIDLPSVLLLILKLKMRIRPMMAGESVGRSSKAMEEAT